MNRTFKRITQYVTVIALTAMLASPVLEARGRNGRNGSNSTEQRREHASRPASKGNSGTSSRPSRTSRTASAPAPSRPGNGGNGANRPGNGNNGANRPGNSGNTIHYRPSVNNTNNSNQNHRPAQAVKPDYSQPAPTKDYIHDNGNNGYRPGNNGNGNNGNDGYRPGNNGNRPGNNGNRPGNNGYRPGDNNHVNRPGYHPDNGHRPGVRPGYRPDHRPGYRPRPPYHEAWRPAMAPPPRPYFRPAPPPRAWRPTVVWPTFHTVLGVSFGTALNVSLNLLMNKGYTVDAYGNDCIYLSNVPMLNCYWPDATLYYGNNGLLSGSFIYSSGVYDMNRYNNVYSMLTANYGVPYQINNNGASISATWWGGNQFITLSYNNAYANNGSLRYFTTLTFGN